MCILFKIFAAHIFNYKVSLQDDPLWQYKGITYNITLLSTKHKVYLTLLYYTVIKDEQISKTCTSCLEGIKVTTSYDVIGKFSYLF